MTTGKTIALTRWTFVGKVMSLLFNKLSRLVIAFLPRSKCLLISWLQSSSAVILEPQNIVSHCFHSNPMPGFLEIPQVLKGVFLRNGLPSEGSTHRKSLESRDKGTDGEF